MPAKRVKEPMVTYSIRVTPQVKAYFECAAARASCNLSDALRKLIDKGDLNGQMPVLGKPPVQKVPLIARRPVSEMEQHLLRQLASIASNVNQIARKVNTHSVSGTQIEAIELLLHLQIIQRLLTQWALEANQIHAH